jgi:apolipoprotein N-acyltransferase
MLRLIEGAGTSLIDSRGQIHNLLPAGQNGAHVDQLQVDIRSTVYQRFGNWLPAGCAFISVLFCGRAVRKWAKSRRRHRR